MYRQLYNPSHPPPVNFYPNLEFCNLRNSESINNITNNDQLWLRTWLSEKKSDSVTINKTSVSFTRKELIEIHSTIKQLQKIKMYLKENINLLTPKEWSSKIQEVNALKVRLQNQFSIFNSNDSLKSIQKHIYKRKIKRLLQQQNKKDLPIKNRFDKHETIDALVRQMKKTLEDNRQIEKRVRDADAVLCNVKIRINEAHHWLSIIENLRTLRAARHTAASGRDEIVDPSGSKTFSKIMDGLCIMWKSRLEKYHTEEFELKSSLAKKELSIQDENKLALKEWETIFWSQLKDYKYDKPAVCNMEAFIAIRREWDLFIVPEPNELGSKIPIGWILPETPSPDWEKYLEKK